MKVAIRFDPEFQGLAIYMYGEDKNGSYIVKPFDIEIEHRDFRGEIVEPTMRLNETDGREFLNGLVNALVEAGFKPDEIQAHDKEVKALNYHLKDMRRLVFAKAKK